MTTFNTIFMNFAWILFPIMLFLTYEAYTENINSKQNELFLHFCLISALYLIIRCGTFTDYTHILEITLDTIILTLYIKKQEKISMLISILTIITLSTKLKIEIIATIIKYVTYALAYKKFKNKKYSLILSF